uniref:Nucleolar protein 6 n=1 Tax=Meleagris gallopavo TaxID=9103 RepID=A0A803YQ82_MELGA
EALALAVDPVCWSGGEPAEAAEAEEVEQGPHTPGRGAARGKKRKAATPAPAPALQPVKLSRAELYKPPTNEELNQLKETEDLFHSSLLRLQIEELLKEVTLKETKKKKIDAFLHEINSLLSAIPETPETDITDQTWLPKGVKVPFLQVPFNVKGKFRFLPPDELSVVGSYLLGTCIKPEINVDVAVTMPREIFQDKDNLNQRYHRKRALYLAHIAQHLSKENLFGSVKFAYMNSNHLKPILLLRPQGKDEKLVTVRLHACPAPNFFKPSRFYPSKNNVRTAWFLEQSTPKEGAAEPATPHYNNSILCDTVLLSHLHFLSSVSTDFPGMKDGLALLKVWLNQRQLSKGLGCFSGFLVSMLVAYLVVKRKIVKVMSGYQVLRNVLQFLGEFPGAPLGNGRLVSVESLRALITAVQFEAKCSMEILDDRMVDGFQALLMTSKPMLRTFDHVFHLKHVSKLQSACKKMELLNELMDRGGNYVAAALPFIISLLTRGLARRALLVAHSLPETPEWAIDAEPPKHKDVGSLMFGILFAPEFAASKLEKGPQADRPEATDFRTFWGEKSELRRFQDGTICEAVVWEASTICQKRLIPEQIVRHLLKLHADIPESSICYTGALLESALGTGEEDMVSVVCSYDDLSRKLWNLEGLPLTVTAVQGVHPALRYTDVFPPVPMKPIYSFHKQVKIRHLLLPSEEKPCPAYITPLKIICHMEGSGQWPQDKEAIKRIKAAFHLQLAELLHQQHQLICRPAVTHTDVYKDGYVFRLQVAYHREPLILKEVVTPEGMLKYQDTEESQRLELEILHQPHLTSSLHGLQQQHPAFGSTCRLAKRWISAQLLSDNISEECVDLLVASLFLHPAPFTPPSSPQVGFLRFLNLLATYDWRNSPLIVNLNADLTGKQEVHRPQLWESRSVRVFTRRSHHHLAWEQNGSGTGLFSLQTVFRPPLDLYDVLIHLNSNQIPRHLESVDQPVKSFSRGVVKNSSGARILFPVVDYDPVQCYLQDLREAFGDLALFFYDKHGGEVIAVLWKPSSFQPQPFKVSNMKGRTVTTLNSELVCVPNIEAILEDFEVLGEGLVKRVEAHTEKWTV